MPTQHWPALALGLLLVWPWLNPISHGPMPAAIPWLLSAICACLVYAGSAWLRPATVARAWLLAACLSAGIALLQYFGLSHWLGALVNHPAVGEAYANLRQRNHFATLMGMGLLALVWQQATSTQRWSVLSALGYGAGAVLLALGNAASSSRTGWLQWWLIALLVLGWWLRARQMAPAWQPRAVLLTLLALVCYLAATVLLPLALTAFTGIHSEGLLGRFQDDVGCGSRRQLWANVLYLIAQRPWLGWGWGELDYAHFVTLYPGARFCEILDNAHNLPLHLAVELGLPVALAAGAGVLWLLWRTRPWQERDATRQLAWGVLAVVALHSLLEYPLWYGPFQIAAVLAVWLLWRPQPALNRFFELLLFSPVKRAGTAAFLLAILAYAGWDYWRVSQLYLAPASRAAAYRDDTLERVRGSWLFRNQVQFAELTTTPLSQANAQAVHDLAQDLLHFSPEPRVIEKLVESAVLLGRDSEALYYLQRYQAAFPQQHAQWAKQLTDNPIAP